MRLIDADALMQAMYHRAFETDGDTMWQSGCWVRYRAIEQTVKEQPTIEAEPVKHGRWEDVEPSLFRDKFATCSVCRVRQLLDKDSFCPNCGARMDEVEDADDNSDTDNI